jgi:7-carboxy-7-deazaguanine synthase
VSAHIASEELAVNPAGEGTLVVSEIFGPTFQGEGPSLGRRCVFLRLGACNLHCRWCDTPYTWDWTGRNGQAYDPRRELQRLDTLAVWQSLSDLGSDTLVISGGEPMLQQASLAPLLERARDAGWWVEIETAGTVVPRVSTEACASRFNVSPKLGNSGNTREERYKPAVLDALQRSGKAAWKFVVQEVADLDEIALLVDRHSLSPIYVMPEGIQPAAIAARGQMLADAVLVRGWNLTTRLHILLYGNRRGI